MELKDFSRDTLSRVIGHVIGGLIVAGILGLVGLIALVAGSGAPSG